MTSRIMRRGGLLQALWLVLALSLQAGCTASRGFDRQAMIDMLGSASAGMPGQQAATQDPIPAALPSPFRLALYFPIDTAPFASSVQRPNWLVEDKDLLKRMLQPLVEDGRMTGAFVLADSTVQDTTNETIRQAAGRYHADVVMVVRGVAAVDRYNNGRAAWYATIIGAYLAQGTHSDALFMIEGTIWDVRSGYRYGTPRGEGTAQSVGPAASLDDKAVVARAKEKALQSLGRDTVELLRRIEGTFHRRPAG